MPEPDSLDDIAAEFAAKTRKRARVAKRWANDFAVEKARFPKPLLRAAVEELRRRGTYERPDYQPPPIDLPDSDSEEAMVRMAEAVRLLLMRTEQIFQFRHRLRSEAAVIYQMQQAGKLAENTEASAREFLEFASRSLKETSSWPSDPLSVPLAPRKKKPEPETPDTETLLKSGGATGSRITPAADTASSLNAD